MAPKRRRWQELETGEKLGYYWVISFGILILGTASAILIPAFLNMLEDAEYLIEDEEGRLESPAPDYAGQYLAQGLYDAVVSADRGAG